MVKWEYQTKHKRNLQYVTPYTTTVFFPQTNLLHSSTFGMQPKQTIHNETNVVLQDVGTF